jgi:hexosaminidase
VTATCGPVIPAPAGFAAAEGRFAARSGLAVVCVDPTLRDLVERFCSDVLRRTALRLVPATTAPQEPHLCVEAGPAPEAAHLAEPTGLAPDGPHPVDERHVISITPARLAVRAPEPVGIVRGLTTVLQLLATAGPRTSTEIALPCGQLVDGPRYAWRGLSLDVARSFRTAPEVRRVIDLLALYKLNVLHLHLTDDQGWRLPFGRTDDDPAEHYSQAELVELVEYAQQRFVTLVPEVDTPGHAVSLVAQRPELDTGRNRIQLELAPGHSHEAVWLDPDLPATFEVIEEVLAATAAIFPGPYLHIGADEPWGMPEAPYARYVTHVRAVVRSLGKHPVGWQESARAGLGPDDVVQYWLTDIARANGLSPEVQQRLDTDLALSRLDLDAAVAAGIPVIVSPLSHCYLDVPYADDPADPSQAQQQSRLGLPVYATQQVADAFDWDPADVLGSVPARVAGVEAAVWAETITDFDDLAFLLLPRLPGVAQKAWGVSRSVGWAEHGARLAAHGRLWEQDSLGFFRTSAVDWH